MLSCLWLPVSALTAGSLTIIPSLGRDGAVLTHTCSILYRGGQLERVSVLGALAERVSLCKGSVCS